MFGRFSAMLLVACALLGGCAREVTRQQVTEFIDLADAAARKRYAPEICELRAKNFSIQTTFHGHEEREPTEMEMTRKLYCQQAGQFSRLRQYRLERKSMTVDVATDRKTATVIAEYVETLPYYEQHTMIATPDDFRQFQVVETTDESVVGIEDGDLKFLSTRSDSHQSLVPKESVQIPYD
jgi:hypothetical protein